MGVVVADVLEPELQRARRSSGEHQLVDRARLAQLAAAHFALVWRTIRRLSGTDADADDGTQEVFVVATRRLADVEEGKERAFLLATAVSIVRTQRRTRARRPECAEVDPDDSHSELADPEQLLNQRRTRELLDQLLAKLPLELRTVLVLVELEQLSLNEVAHVEGLAQGTVASRLRRARELFFADVKRLHARLAITGDCQ